MLRRSRCVLIFLLSTRTVLVLFGYKMVEKRANKLFLTRGGVQTTRYRAPAGYHFDRRGINCNAILFVVSRTGSFPPFPVRALKLLQLLLSVLLHGEDFEEGRVMRSDALFSQQRVATQTKCSTCSDEWCSHLRDLPIGAHRNATV